MQEKHSKEHIIKSVGIFSFATSISRILGYIRDAINASLFGAGYVSDAFFVAFRIPNLLRDLLGEGALSMAFIPTFTEYLQKKSKNETYELASIIFNILVIIFSIIVLLGILLSPIIVRIMAPGFTIEAMKLTISLTRIIFPFIAFMGFAALFMGILNSYQHFTIPALASVFMNIVIIIFGIFICPLFGEKPEQQIFVWTIGTLLGGLVQALIQIPILFKKGIRYIPKLNFISPVKRIFKLMVPAIFSNSVNQINVVLVNTIMASFLGEAAITYLYYGNRLMQLPLGIFGVAIATAAFPTISMHAANADIEKIKETVSFALRMVFFITLPATIGLIVLSLPINTLLFRYGRFTAESAIATANASIYYSIGLFAFAGLKVIVPSFYALQDSKTPVKVGIAAVIINIVLSVFLMDSLGYCGLALSTSISGILNFSILFIMLRNKLNGLDEKRIFKSFVRTFFAAIFMGVSCYFFADYIKSILNINIYMYRILYVFISILFGILAFCGLSFLLKVEEIHSFYQFLKKKFLPSKADIIQ
ncbi:MAG: murein biosynthesis integral membrane protein MurJ [Candidatus Firestonebacteria bacterium]